MGSVSVDVHDGWHVHDLRAVAWSESNLRKLGEVQWWEAELERDAQIGGARIYVVAEGRTVEDAVAHANVAIDELGSVLADRTKVREAFRQVAIDEYGDERGREAVALLDVAMAASP